MTEEAKEKLLDESNYGEVKPLFFKINGTIEKIIKSDKTNIFYLACPNCRKKVQNDSAGYFC